MSATNKTIQSGVFVVIGAFIGAGTISFLQSSSHTSHTSHTTDSSANNANKANKAEQPLYWVAPMDANYRRDAPGLSPMGMELIPVYQDGASDDFGAGAVKIAPHVMNNLGVKTEKVERKILQTDISTVGYVQFDEDKIVHIHPRVEGWIEKLYIKAAGDPVEKKQAMYTLYSPQLVNAQEEFLLALERKNQALIQASRERLSALNLSKSFVSALEQTKKIQQNVTFYAHQSGVVNKLNIREGFYVKPGTTLMSIGQLEHVWVEAEIFERDSMRVKAGANVSMTLDYLPGREWLGVVDYVYPSLNEKNRTLRVRVKLDNKDLALKPNMFAQVVIHENSDTATILAPKESIIRTGKQDRVVLALGDGQFKSIDVTLGRIGKEYIEILEGLNEEDEVVTSAQFLIDSESSKSSDFKRMSNNDVPNTVWIEGELNNVMAGHRMINVTHAPVPEWNWPDMTMNFMVAENTDMTSLKPGQSLHFEVRKTDDGEYETTTIHIMSEPKPVSSDDVDHSNSSSSVDDTNSVKDSSHTGHSSHANHN